MQRLDAEAGLFDCIWRTASSLPRLVEGRTEGEEVVAFLKPLGEQSHQMSLTLPEMPGVAAEADGRTT